MRNNRRMMLAAIGVTVALSMGACAGRGSPGPDGSTEGVTGTLRVSGSSTVEPITSLVAERFVEANPAVEPSVDGPGTGDGFELFCSGETDVQDASRPIEKEEVAACRASGIDFVELEIALDGLSVVGHPSNPIDCMRIGDLYALFGPESDGFGSWPDAEALAKDVGGRGDFPEEELVIVAPGEESGTYGSFVDLAIGDIAEERGEAGGQLRADYQSSADDNVIVDNAAGTTGGLGFVGLAFAEGAGGSVKEFGIDGGGGCVVPTAEAVADGSYPLSRSLYLYVSKRALAGNPLVRPFIEYYLSDEGLAAVPEVAYVELPPERLAMTRAAWAEGAAG